MLEEVMLAMLTVSIRRQVTKTNTEHESEVRTQTSRLRITKALASTRRAPCVNAMVTSRRTSRPKR